MSTVVNLNGVPYLIPATGDVGWGQEVSSYLIALGTGGVLTLEGGNFTLLNELNTGPTYGIASPYFRSGLNPASSTGVLRLTNAERIAWRNATNTADLPLYVVGNNLYFNGSAIGGGTASPLTTKGDIYTYDTNNTRLPVGANGTVLTADSSTATGLAWTTVGGGGGGSVVGFTFTDANGIAGTVTNPTTTPTLSLALGAITPTSVAASGTVTGSNITGSINGTFTGTSSGTNTGDQTITLTGDVTGSGTGSFATTLATVPIAKGGTGQTTANAALNALLPSQATNNGKVLYTNGTDASWASFPGAGSVTSVSGIANNGTIISIANPTTTPAITIGLGAITPTSVAASGTVTGSNISGTASGTNTGDQTISLTGDVTGSGTGTFAATLSTTGVTAASYTNASITVDAKGRITAAANGTLQTITLTGDVTGSGTGSFATTLANSGVTAGTYNTLSVNAKGIVTSASNTAFLTANQTITVSGDATGSGSTGIALTLANTAVAAGSYTRANITVDSKGRITSASNGSAVTSVSVVTANGVSGSVANPSTTPAITLSLGAITPTSVAASGTVTGSNLSGTNTGNQVIVLSGDATNSNTSTGGVLTLANTAVTPGSYTNANITVDSKGRITSAANGTVTGTTAELYTTANPANAGTYNVAKYSLTSNLTITKPTSIPSGGTDSYTITYFIKQHASSLYTLTWFTNIQWKNGAVPTMSQLNNATDIFVMTTFDGGTNWFGTPIQGYI